jgi:transposase-like protein
MSNKQLNQNNKRHFSSKKKCILVEEIRSGMLSIQQSSRQYQLSQSVLQRWNRWYFKTRLLKYVQPKFAIMKSSEDPDQLKQQLKEAQAQLEQLKLKNVALETMISIAEKELKIHIRKKSGTKPSNS